MTPTNSELDNWWSDWNVHPMPSRPKEKLKALINKQIIEAKIETLKITDGHQKTGTQLNGEYFTHNISMLEKQLRTTK